MHFGGFEAFRAQFSQAATTVQGSGWALLTGLPGVEAHATKFGSPSFPAYGYDVRLLHEETAEEVGATAAFLASPLGAGITGTTVYVDKGYHAMGAPAQSGLTTKASSSPST